MNYHTHIHTNAKEPVTSSVLYKTQRRKTQGVPASFLHYILHNLLNLLLLLWRYSPGWALASITLRLKTSRSLALSPHSFIHIFLRSVDTSSSHLVFSLPLRLVAYSFPYIFLRIAVKIYGILCIYVF
jgi:hypothetical protein